jgi:hypothetical protein
MQDTEYCPNFVFIFSFFCEPYIFFFIGVHLTNYLSIIFTEEIEENTNESIVLLKNISSQPFWCTKNLTNLNWKICHMKF